MRVCVCSRKRLGFSCANKLSKGERERATDEEETDCFFCQLSVSLVLGGQKSRPSTQTKQKEAVRFLLGASKQQ